MARRGVPIIAPALAQQAVRCIKKAADGMTALAESDLALGMAIHTVSKETGLSCEDLKQVLEELARLDTLCLVIEEPEEEKKPRRKKRQIKKKKKK